MCIFVIGYRSRNGQTGDLQEGYCEDLWMQFKRHAVYGKRRQEESVMGQQMRMCASLRGKSPKEKKEKVVFKFLSCITNKILGYSFGLE